HVDQERMIRPRARDVEQLQRASRLPGGAAQRLEEHLLADEARAGAGQEDAARRDGLQRQLVHVEVALEREIDLLAIASLLRWIEDHHVETLARRHDVAQPGEQVGLREANAGLVEVGILLRQRDHLLVEIDADHFLRLAKRLRINGKAAGVAAEIEYLFAGTEARQELAVVAL